MRENFFAQRLFRVAQVGNDANMPIKISQQFDAGAIEVVQAGDFANIELRVRKDTRAEFAQWFYFRLQGAKGEPCTMRFLNAGQAAYPSGWEDYRVVASYDRIRWFRVPTSYDGQVMTVQHTPECDSVYYAYFEPYSWERHLDLLGRVEKSPLARVVDLGSSIEGRDMNVVVVGNPQASKKVWVIARQHPGETMAEWFVDGMLDALLDPDNATARAALERAAFYIVPNMNPDGSVLGNLRTNAAGANLNREWMTPSLETSPEVYCVRQKIHEIGCDLFLDVHGDEGIPYVFAVGNEMLETFTEKQAEEQNAFLADCKDACTDFQLEHGYPASKYKEEVLKLASKYIAHTFKCVSLTLEMPFKDHMNQPDAEFGWNGARSKRLGREILLPILKAVSKPS
jgi:murein tripeptide amidase MpaA